MPQITKSVLVMHRAEQMFSLVEAVEQYPQFLPWCRSSTVHQRDAACTVATLGIDYHGLKSSFTTCNQKSPNAIAMALKDGPFEKLNGGWRFTPLGEDACKVEFELDYTFASRTLEKVVGPVFNRIAATFVDAFIRQADKLYG